MSEQRDHEETIAEIHARAQGFAKSPVRMKENPDGANLPVFLSAKNISPFIDNDLVNGLGRRRLTES